MTLPWVDYCLKNTPCVLVTLRQKKGSSPRESGARMVVDQTGVHGSIGGGNLEHQAISTAREMLENHWVPDNATRVSGMTEVAGKSGMNGEAPPSRHPGNPSTSRHPGDSSTSRHRDDSSTSRHPGDSSTSRHPGDSSTSRHPGDSSTSRHRDDSSTSRHPGNPNRIVRDPVPPPRLEPYGLGPHLNQCCGGSVELLFEVIPSPAPDWLVKLAGALEQGDHVVLATATGEREQGHYVTLPVGRQSELPDALRPTVKSMLDDASSDRAQTITAEGCDWWLERVSRARRQLWLFGAGHVGKAVVKALADLPFEICWLDGREEEFPNQIPDNVTVLQSQDLPGEVSKAAADTTFLVMTHSHELDEDICHAALKRNDFAYLGMIGSRSKGRRFVHRLGKRGIPETALARLVCPIGLPNITGKEPATIALSLAAQLMSNDKE